MFCIYSRTLILKCCHKMETQHTVNETAIPIPYEEKKNTYCIYSQVHKYWDIDTILIRLALYTTTMDFKWNERDVLYVQTFSFNLRVFTSKSGERCRNYNSFYMCLPLFKLPQLGLSITFGPLKSGRHISIVVVYRAKKMRIVSMSQYLWTWLYTHW